MTPTQIKVLIALWRRQRQNLMFAVSPEDISIELTQTVQGPCGVKRVETALRHLQEMKMIKESQFTGLYDLAKKGRTLIAALEEMGLRGEF
jgi:hypothetical protein